MGNNINKRTLELEDTKTTYGKEADYKSKSNKKAKWKDKNKKKWKGKQSNDPQWHLKNAEIVKDLANIPFNTMMGFPPRNKTVGLVNYVLGCIRSYFFDWYAGKSEDFRSFLNAAATNLWEFVRSRNSGSTNYQSADIFINVILGCLDIFATSDYLARFFGMTTMYSAYNRMIPKTLFDLCGIDYEDFISNEANYRGKYNILLAKASSVVVPGQFPIYDWITSLGRDIYKDRDSETGREQLIIGVKEFFHIYDPTADPQGGMIRYMKVSDLPGETEDKVICFGPNMPNRMNKFSLLLNIWEAQINAIITDEDCNIIFGDLIKAYGSEGKFWKTSPLVEGYKIAPVYSEEFLYQFHNAILLPAHIASHFDKTASGISWIDGAYNCNDIKQDGNGYIVVDFKRNVAQMTIFESNLLYKDDCKLLLDTDKQNPTPEDIMTMTRWHNRYVYVTENNVNYLKVLASSAVMLSDGEIVYIRADNVVSRYTMVQFMEASDSTPIYGSSPIVGAIIASNFDWQPIFYVYDNTNISGGIGTVLLADVNNVQSVEYETIQRIHEVDFASLYDVPFTGKF